MHSGAFDHPSVAEFEAGLNRWATRWPERIAVDVRGRSAENRPIMLARVTDMTVPDTDKAIVLLSGTHVGAELNGCTGLLHLAHWLLSDDPAAERIRKGIVTLVMPCVNPDGYDRVRSGEVLSDNRTTKGINVYGDWTLDGPKNPQNNPEGVAVFEVAEQYQPDAALDAHGFWQQGMSMWESTAFSWGCFEAHSFNATIVEQINLAAEKEGFLIVRPEEDSGRIKVRGRSDEGVPHHFYYIRGDRTIMSFLYNRYHTLAINCEVGYEQSLVARARRLLELGLEVGRHEFFPGYPTNQIGGWGSMTISAWGDTAEKRRRSRVELWRKGNQLCYSLVGPQPASEKMMAVCTTMVDGAMRWLGTREDIVSPPNAQGPNERMSVPTMKVLQKLASHPRMDAQYIEEFMRGTVMTNFPNPEKMTQRGVSTGTMGFDPESASDEPLQHGLSMRLLIPYPDAEIVDARMDGHHVDESPTDGYVVRREPGTVVQFNIPPEKVGDLHIATCEYKSSIRRRQGFSTQDWE